MKRFSRVLISFLVLLGTLTWSSYSEKYLAIIDNLTNQQIQNSNLHVFDQLRNHSFAILDDRDIAFLDGARCTYSIVDQNPLGKLYFLVYVEPDVQVNLSAVARVLHRFNDCYLVQVEKTKRQTLLDLRAEFNQLDLDPMQFSHEIHPQLKNLPKTIPFDPIIKEIVAKVTTDSIIDHITWMQNVGTRHCSYKDMEEKIVPWTIQKFKDYGCDSIYTFAVSGYKAPNVVGVKYGVKDPSPNHFAAIGAHIDAVPRASRNRGADDNAAGFSCVLEAARIFKDYQFEYTINFIAWNCEEVGLRGSAALAKRNKSNGDRIIGVINAEMPGHVPPGQKGYISVTPKRSVAGSRELANLYIEMGEKYTSQAFHDDPSEVTNSDHASYWRQGYCAIKLREKIKGSSYHTQNDTLFCRNGLNTPEQVTRTAQAGLATLCKMAGVLPPTAQQQGTKQSQTSGFLQLLILDKMIPVQANLKEQESFFIHLFNASGQKIMSQGPNVYSKKMNPITIANPNQNHLKKIPQGICIMQIQRARINTIKTVLLTH